ncbi:MAG: hypothetical protein PHI98_15240 [Eubacteriales bacterium]|nr:hypothetical protein [Eubacteriales bacterium]
MKKKSLEGPLACVGAVIGAGFVSGREIITFFSRYGAHSWWLLTLSAIVMMGLCVLCMRRAINCNHQSWCGLYSHESALTKGMVQICLFVLLSVIGGAMLSASGHMIMLLWPSDWAYTVGLLGSLGLAWYLGYGNLKGLSVLSSALTFGFICVMVLFLKKDSEISGVVAVLPPSFGTLLWATVCAVGYAAMNLTIAIGVVCKVSCGCCRKNDRQSVAFGFILLALLFLSNYLYLKHPELTGEVFPVVRLFAAFGRVGYILSIILLYMAILTTLTAILYALRGALETRIPSKRVGAVVAMGTPTLISFIGFSGIVEGLYAPIGMICMAVVFFPLLQNKKMEAKP